MQRTASANQGRPALLTSYVRRHRRAVAGLWLVFTLAGIAGGGRVYEALTDPTVPGRDGYERNSAILLSAWLAAVLPVGRRASQTWGGRKYWAAP